MIGKPYSGKPNVRFDEGELEIELLATTPALYSNELVESRHWFGLKNRWGQISFVSSSNS